MRQRPIHIVMCVLHTLCYVYVLQPKRTFARSPNKRDRECDRSAYVFIGRPIAHTVGGAKTPAIRPVHNASIATLCWQCKWRSPPSRWTSHHCACSTSICACGVHNVNSESDPVFPNPLHFLRVAGRRRQRLRQAEWLRRKVPDKSPAPMCVCVMLSRAN